MKRQKDNPKGPEKDLLGLTPVSAEAVFSNEDLLYEILLRVPAKSLIRFKCVAKYWRGLISDQQFGYNHTTQNRESISALYFYMRSFNFKCDRLKSVSLCGHRNLPSLSFLSGINWIIKVVHFRSGLTLCTFGWPEKYIVCNLTTQKYVIISQPVPKEGFIDVCSLAYDPAVSPYYKIISFGDLCCGSYPIDIYSSEKSSWTQVHSPKLVNPPMNLTAFFNGSIHWMSSDYYFRFEVETEKLTKTRMSSVTRILGGYNIKFFGECGGNLLLVQYASPYVVGLRILQMEMDTGRWILKQRVNLRTIAEAFPDERIRFDLLTILKGSHDGDIILVLRIEGKVIAFYPNCKQFKAICDTPEEFLRFKYLQKGGSYQHFESLSPV